MKNLESFNAQALNKVEMNHVNGGRWVKVLRYIWNGLMNAWAAYEIWEWVSEDGTPPPASLADGIVSGGASIP